MKVIDSKTETGTNNAKVKKYILDTGYVMTDYEYETGDTASVLTTTKGKLVDQNSVTFKRAEASVNKWANRMSRSKL